MNEMKFCDRNKVNVEILLPIAATHFLRSIRNCFILLIVPWGLRGPLQPGTGIMEESPSINL